jgi:hypothetical protein
MTICIGRRSSAPPDMTTAIAAVDFVRRAQLSAQIAKFYALTLCASA